MALRVFLIERGALVVCDLLQRRLKANAEPVRAGLTIALGSQVHSRMIKNGCGSGATWEMERPPGESEFIGDAWRVGLESQPERLPVAVVPTEGVVETKAFEIRQRERDALEALSLRADESDGLRGGTGNRNRLDLHRLAEERS